MVSRPGAAASLSSNNAAGAAEPLGGAAAFPRG